MDDISRKKAQRFDFLRALYDESGADSMKSVSMTTAAGTIGVEGAERKSIESYLQGEDLIYTGNDLPYPEGRITHKGIREVEASLTSPDKPTPVMNVVNNFHGNMTNSQLQQGTHGSSQSLTLSQENSAKLSEFVAEFARVVNEMALSSDDKVEALSDIVTVQAQLKSPKPKAAIISESVKSLFRILEGAASNAIAAGLLQQFAGLM